MEMLLLTPPILLRMSSVSSFVWMLQLSLYFLVVKGVRVIHEEHLVLNGTVVALIEDICCKLYVTLGTLQALLVLQARGLISGIHQRTWKVVFLVPRADDGASSASDLVGRCDARCRCEVVFGFKIKHDSRLLVFRVFDQWLKADCHFFVAEARGGDRGALIAFATRSLGCICFLIRSLLRVSIAIACKTFLGHGFDFRWCWDGFSSLDLPSWTSVGKGSHVRIVALDWAFGGLARLGRCH
jgi:hypothetical protein